MKITGPKLPVMVSALSRAVESLDRELALAPSTLLHQLLEEREETVALLDRAKTLRDREAKKLLSDLRRAMDLTT